MGMSKWGFENFRGGISEIFVMGVGTLFELSSGVVPASQVVWEVRIPLNPRIDHNGLGPFYPKQSKKISVCRHNGVIYVKKAKKIQFVFDHKIVGHPLSIG